MLIADLHESIRLHVLAHIKSRQITQPALAERIGVKQAHISNFLLGRRGLSIGAMDAILKVLGVNVQQLISAADQTRRPKRSPIAVENVPLIQFRAAMKPAFADDDIDGEIGFTKAILRRLKAEPPDTRKLWARFIAIRADKALSAPMNPKVENGSILLVDRHYCSLAAYRKDDRNLYLIREGDLLMLRRIEIHRDQLCLRPENPSYPLDFICIDKKKPLDSCVVGRVTHIATEI